MKNIIAALLLFFSFNNFANSSGYFKTGFDLENGRIAYEKTTASNNAKYEDTVIAVSYTAYITGIYDVTANFICAPKDVTGFQIMAIVGNFIKDNPKKWNLPSVGIIVDAISDAYPCEKK